MTCNSPNSRIGVQILVLLSVIVATTCSKAVKSPTEPSPPPAAGSKITYTAIGASDATGHGSTVPCDVPFQTLETCPNGMGYVYVASRQLQAQGFTVTLRNMGIPASVISRGFQNLGQQYNHPVPANFIETEMPIATARSSLKRAAS